MPRALVEDNSRLALRARAEDKAALMHATALENADMTDFILLHATDAARKVIDQSERMALSERDSLRVFDALENPPEPSPKLLAAARHLQRLK